MREWLQDIRYSLRAILRTPAFTALAVLTLALGIGANTTIFSWINSTLLDPVPGVSHTGDLLSLSRGKTVDTAFPFSYPDYVDLRDGNRTLSGLAAASLQWLTLSGTGQPERVWGSLVSANYFDLVGVKFVLGSGFPPGTEEKPGSAPFVVISHRFWQMHFGADPAIIGKTIHLNQHPFTIAGVTAPLFQGTYTGLRAELWIPATMQRQTIATDRDVIHIRETYWFILLGRLKPGVTRLQAQDDMNVVMQRIAQQYPDSHKGHDSLTAYPLWRAPFGANGYLSILLPMLMAIAGMVLLLACTNVANLLLVRSVGQRREAAIRLSLGSGRWRLVRQSLLESLMLALLGGALAVVLTLWSAGTLMDFVPPSDLPVAADLRVDRTVLLAGLVISVFTGLIFGTLPALRSSRLAPLAVLKEESSSASGARHKARLSSVLAVAQISLSLFLLVCAGLFIRSFQKAQHTDPGFNAEHVLLGTFDLSPFHYTNDRTVEFNKELLARMQALPGVQSVSLASWVPLGFIFNTDTVKPEGYQPQLHEAMDIDENSVGPDYLRTMQIPLIEGREFTMRDDPGSLPVAVVNQSFVDHYWPHQDAIGKRVYALDKWFSVVGVARNSSYNLLREDPKPFLYLPLFQALPIGATVHLRVADDPAAFASVLESTIHQLNAELPVSDVDTLKARVQTASIRERIAGTFVSAFGALALVLGTIGIYGVVSYTTRQRTREFGIRMALGAQRLNILSLVLNHGLALIATGIAIGIVVSLAACGFLRSMLVLFGVTMSDAITFAGVATVLCMAALLACYLPARRATRVDPVIALKYE